MVIGQIHPWEIGTDHSPPHTPILMPVVWYQRLLKPSCMSLCLGTLNKQDQKTHYLSLIAHFFPVHSLFGKESCCSFPCVLTSIKGSCSHKNWKQGFGSEPVKWGWEIFPGEKSKDVSLGVMKKHYCNIHGVVSWIQLDLSCSCGKLCMVGCSASSQSSGADVLYTDFDQVTQMAVS